MSEFSSNAQLATCQVDMALLLSRLGIRNAAKGQPTLSIDPSCVEDIFDSFKALDACFAQPIAPSPTLSAALASPRASLAMVIAKEAVADIGRFCELYRRLSLKFSFPHWLVHREAGAPIDDAIDAFWRRIKNGQHSLAALGVPGPEADAFLTRAFCVASFDALIPSDPCEDLIALRMLFARAPAKAIHSPGIAMELSLGEIGAWSFHKALMFSPDRKFVTAHSDPSPFEILAWTSRALKKMDEAVDVSNLNCSPAMIDRLSILLAFNDACEKSWISSGFNAQPVSADMSPESFFQGYASIRLALQALRPTPVAPVASTTRNLGIGPLIAANREQLSIAGKLSEPPKPPGRIAPR